MTQLTNALPASLKTILDEFLKDNKQAIFSFRTLEANKNTMPVQGADGVTNAVVNSARILPGATKIRTVEGEQHKLLYSVRERMETFGGQSTTIQEPEPIVFEPKDFCVLSVSRNNRELLTRLLFSNECSNGLNPAKEEPVVGYSYELIQPAKTAEQLVINKERVLDAQLAVRAATDTELTLACERLELPVQADRNANASSLYAKAESDPEGVFRVLGAEWDKTVALVRDLTAAGVIEFDSAARTYLTTADRKPFHNVLAGNQELSLVKWLSDTQGQKTKSALARLLEEKTKKGGKR